MRRIRFIMPLMLVMLASCSKNVIRDNTETGEATLSIALSSDSAMNQTKADDDATFLNEFRVAIYKTATKMRLYNDSYANTIGRTIKLNAGEYRLVAQHGDSLGCGFNKPYYMADKTFKLEGGANSVSAIAKLSNVKLAVSFHSTISEVYPDYYAVVRHSRYSSKSVKFTKTETRNGYIPAGDLYLEVYALVDGNWKYFKSAPATYNPNDFVTFSITTDNTEGGIAVTIITDTGVDKTENEFVIPSVAAPQDAPSITLAGFGDAGNVHSFVEGQSPEGHNAQANFIARGALKHCYLIVNSDYLAAKGISGKIDLAQLESGVDALLKSAGFVWDESMAGSRTFSFVDFSAVLKDMMANVKAQTEENQVASFKLEVVDQVNKSQSMEFSIVSKAVTMSLSFNENDVWAKRLAAFDMQIVNGIQSLVTMQISKDGVSWTEFNSDTVLDPATHYYLRSEYNGGNLHSNVAEFTTEAASQIGNAGFEDYMKTSKSIKITGGSRYNLSYYLPYAEGEANPWWTCNSLKTMPNEHVAGQNWCKAFPSSGFTTDAHSGSKAVLIYNVNCDGWNSSNTAVGSTVAGELWIGSSDENGNHSSEGHAFASRPSALSFWYKYSPNSSNSFYVYSCIKDASGNIIAEATVPAGAAASEWTKHTIEYNYSATDRKAASIYMIIKSAGGSKNVSTEKSFELGGENVTAHAGSFLKIDDIELIY